MSRKTVKVRRKESPGASAQPLSDSEYGLAGQDFVRAVAQMKAVEITVQALRRIRTEKPPEQPMSTCFLDRISIR